MARVITALDERDNASSECAEGVPEDRVRHRGLSAPASDGPRASSADGIDVADASDAERRRPISFATMRAGPRENRLALAVVVLSAVAFVVTIPFARMPLVKVPAFLSGYEATLTIIDLITAILLFGQASQTRSRAFLALAAGYLFNALIIIPHALTFPGLFAPTGLLGAGDQTTAWLYVFWRGGFPLFALAYAMLAGRAIDDLRENAPVAIAVVVAIVVASVCVLTVIATAGHDLLPVLIRGGDYSLLMITTGVSPALCGLNLLALIALWRRRAVPILDLWLSVVLCAWLFDVGLSAIVGSSRYDLGWYAGRAYGLLGTTFTLAVLLREISGLQTRLAGAKAQLEDHARMLERRIREHIRAEAALRHAKAATEEANRELDAFSYSVAHDLRAPLRSIDGFSQALIEDCAERLDEQGKTYLGYVRESAQHMARLIDDLLSLSRVSRAELHRTPIDLAAIARTVFTNLQRSEPDRRVEVVMPEAMTALGDARLLGIALENLLGNAWKFTRKRAHARIELGQESQAEGSVYFIRDNGAGFDMAYAGKLFSLFQRLHAVSEFEGTGIGLATVQRIIHRHGGRVWAEGEGGRGATFYFTLEGGT